MMDMLRDWKFSVLLAGAALGVALGLREPLTALMSLHMLVQIPLLVLAGLFAEQAWHGFHAFRRRAAVPPAPAPAPARASWSWNAYGLPGLLLVSLVGACWMIPKALDDALVDWRVVAFKYLGLPVCGWILRASLRESNVIVKLFFLGNFCWMSAIVGMVYLDQPIRLCNAYLQDDQDWSGRGLIALAIVLPSSWLLAELKPIWRFLNR
ncbi:Cytochrome c oxidase assembly protein OS=Castellaniella defragrans OX=75697 GN=HNR28_001795 PE=4 SV=1 [Castellaniella defragrans]